MNLETAKTTLLAPYDLEAAKLERVFGTLSAHKVDYADLYFQYSRFEGWSLEEGIVKSGSFNIEQGVGVRAVSGEKTAFAYSDEISFNALQDAAKATRAIASAGQGRKTRVGRPALPVPLYRALDPVASLESTQKVALLEKLERKCRALDPRVNQVMASLGGEYEVVLIARADGTLAADVRPLVRLSVQVIAEANGRRESGSGGGGGRTDYAHFTDEVLDEYARHAVSQALVNLEARPAPAGTMTVVLGPGWPGVLLHEAIGHGLEGDFNRKGSSAFSGRLGQRVAAPGVTVVDDGTLPGRRGSLTIDDEGNPTQRNVLIEDGVLRAYLQDSLNARLMKMPITGNGAPRVVRPSHAAAHDEHLHARRIARSEGDHRQREEGPVCNELRRRAGGHHQRQVRVLGRRGLPHRGRQGDSSGQGRDADRQRPRCAHAREHDRQRSRAR